MQFQAALVWAMQESKVDETLLAARTGSNPRWITEITTNPDWRPKLDTILRLCHALKFNVLTFLDYAEVGSRGQHPTPNTQHPTENRKQKPALGKTYGISVEQQMKLILVMMPSHVAWTLKILRKECGISQDRLEEITPFSKSTISLREGRRNQNYPTTTTLGIYCQAYGIRLTEFVSRLFQEVQLDTLPVMNPNVSLCYC
ncbi:helix-turn-helix domain-containing protein [Sphaerochaeta sp. S2]|uniref:helix-turn-helix domain-containing protein n=1 Tax=Sphaerochaeta sp. S2 TaxID=2798868 RepID=UPI0018E942DE|nr:helix-turn-helix transcriptional regulator [Sphaerochaeta sp. S2]MBJ2357860.1 helix-turn-helix transcriptional regulator [Sphaerochaeta sp. S2]